MCIRDRSKRIILSGDNLLDAQPRMNNETNETVVSFTLDRVGAKRFGKATSTGIGKKLAIVLDGKIIENLHVEIARKNLALMNSIQNLG